MARFTLRLNGTERMLDVDGDTPLLWVLRDDLGLTGTKFGCGAALPQCGYCQSGQLISAIALLKAIRKPSDRDIDLAMNGNLCRCATYVRIRAAIHDAARELGG